MDIIGWIIGFLFSILLVASSLVCLYYWVFRRELWKERKVRSPEIAGSIEQILAGEYPSPEIREYLRIGTKKNKQITWVERIFMVLFLVRTYVDLGYFWRKIRRVRAKYASDLKEIEEADSQLIEKYILFRTILLVSLLILPLSSYRWLARFIAAYILWEILGLLFQPLRMLFVDRYAYDKNKDPPYRYWLPYSFNRSLLLLLWSYLEMVIGFAYMYRQFDIISYADCTNLIATVREALYFSVVTITTLGYGDMRPLPGWGRFFASIEPIMGIVLLVMVVGLFFVELGRQKRSKNNK
jgi:hypothetical protein